MHIPLLQPLNGISCDDGYLKGACWGLTPQSIVEVQTAAFTGITVCLTSITVFNSTISAVFPPHFMVSFSLLIFICRDCVLQILGLAGALIVSYLDLRLSLEWSLKTTVASWLGCACGSLIVYVVSALNEGDYNPYLGIMLAVPASFLLSLADQAGEVYCKLSCVYRGDKALLLLIIPIVFGGEDPYWSALTAATGYTIGSLIPLMGTLLMWSLRMLPDTRLESLRRLSVILADYSDEITFLWRVTDQEGAVVRRMWDDLYQASTEAAASTSDPKLRGTIWSMFACLSTVRRSSQRQTLEAEALETPWSGPFDGEMVSLRQKVVTALRVWDDHHEFDNDIITAARHLSSSVEKCRARADVRATTESKNSEFAINEMVKFSLLVHEFLIRVKGSNGDSSVATKVADWFRQPFFTSANPEITWRVRLAYPLRAAITVPLVALFLTVGGQYFAVLSHFGLWLMLPCLFCFLPTPGASIRKGLRRIVGTVVASILAVVCVSMHPNNECIFLCELFVFSVIAKLMFFHDTLQYSGLVFGFTWIIVGLGPGIDADLPVGSKVSRAIHRMDMTVAGVVLSIVLTSLISPVFAYKRLRRATVCSLELVSNSVVNACESVVYETPWNREALSKDVLNAAILLDRSYSNRHAQIADARAECQALRYVSPARHSQLGHLVAAQHLVDRLTRRSLVVISAVTTCLASKGCGLPEAAQRDLLLVGTVIRRRCEILVAAVKTRKFKLADISDSVMCSILCLQSNSQVVSDVAHYALDCLVHALHDFGEVWEEVERMLATPKYV